MARIIGALRSAVRLYNAVVDSYPAVLFTTDSRTLAGELLRLLYRAAACRVDPQFVSAVVRRAHEAYKVLKYLAPLMAPLVVRLVRYLQEPAVHMEPHHQRERSYAMMTERECERRQERQITRRLTTTRTNINTRAR